MRTFFCLVACLVAFAVLSGCMAPHMLVVTQYADDSPRAAEVVDSLQQAFQGRELRARWSVFHMNTQSHPTEQAREVSGDLAVMRANAALGPHLVFSVGDEAARYFAQRLAGTRTRIVFLGVKGDPADYDFVMSSNVTGVRERVPVLAAFSLMKEMVPAATKAAVLADRSLEGDAVVAQIQAASGLPLRVVEIRKVGTLQEWMAALAEFQGAVDMVCVASYGTVLRGPDSRDAVPPAELLRMTAQVNRLPDFSFWKDAAGPEGLMAAVYVPGSSQAEMAAGIAEEVLRGRVVPGQVEMKTCTECARAFNEQRASLFGVGLPAPVEEPAPEVMEEEMASDAQEVMEETPAM